MGEQEFGAGPTLILFINTLIDGNADVAGLLKAASMVLVSTVGGASGPLYGTFFLRASAACAGKASLGADDLAALCEAGLAGVLQRAGR